MIYNINDIPKIVGYKTWSDKKKIDTLLEMDALMYCDMGMESSKTYKQNVKKKSRKIYYAIKQVDSDLGEKLIHAMD
jgi:hypothetical protein